MLFPGQGSQTADMREQVERHRPDLLELARAEVSDDLFERAGEGTRWAQPAIFCAALDEGESLLREQRVRAKRLPVAGAFHSPLMEPAVEPFRRLAEHVEVRAPRVPVLSCVTAAPFQDVREQLVQAIVSPVRWTDVMSALQNLGATRYVETGPGRVLTNLVRKSLEDVEAEAPLAMEAAGA